MKKYWWGLVLALVLAAAGNDAWASGFQIKSIGNVETGGRPPTHWWTTGGAPVLRGEATPGAEVVIDIDGKALAIFSDSSGDWNFQPEAVADGDHQISVTSNGSTIKFTLTTGRENVDWNAVGSGNPETLPTVGTAWPTILAITAGLSAVWWSGKMIVHAQK